MKKALLKAIRVYRKYISPLKTPCCRFYPTCSQYALDAVREYGALKGAGMSIIRVLKCNPFHPGGYDPVRPRPAR